ncbi:MAG TPA: acyl-CoA synthetase [Thermohalobaculum sp.]|nr:acyl-CoA synthetase [Thermohalobaculum sp.]
MAERIEWATLEDKADVERVPYEERWPPCTVYRMLQETAAAHADRPALSFQIKSGPDDSAETMDWRTVLARTTQTANMLRALGIGAGDTVAALLPNCNEMALTLIGGMTAGIVTPINPLLEVEQIASLLRETRAKVLVTLAPFPRSDVANKAQAAAAEVDTVETILEVDLKHYLSGAASWLMPFLRPKMAAQHRAPVKDFWTELRGQPDDRLTFEEGDDTRIAACFHTGGTTGMPKLAPHRQRGMVYNGRIPALHMIGETDVLICPLPLFHVFATYPILMTCLASGAHFVMPTPGGFRGEGVITNFWKLVERWRVTFMIMVPTAASALVRRDFSADTSSLRYAVCGSAPMPVRLFERFEEATGVKILEGYGMTEATCLVSINPPHGERKIGSVGYPIAYTDLRILQCDADGNVVAECGADEVGEICIRSPGVFPGYTDERRNEGLFTGDGWLRTGDLGRIDADGYVWITGRAKDLIIRGGHNIDPAVIEEALLEHPAVAMVGAVGQPDARSGELPCAYVELKEGAHADPAELAEFAREHVPERAAAPRHIEVVDTLPITAVGKIYKPDLRKRAIARVYGKALAEAGIQADVIVVEDKTRGLVAELVLRSGAQEAEIAEVLDPFARPWRLRQ